MNPSNALKLGEFQLDPTTPVLTLGSSVVELPPKALDILLVLVRNAGRVVRHDDLLDLVWPDTAVEEGNIAVYISHLRRAFGDNRRSQHAYIETIPKRGYRFAAAVQPVGHSASEGNSDLAALGRAAAHYLASFTAEGCRTAEVLLRRFIDVSSDTAWARALLAQSLLMQCLLGSAGQERAAAKASELLNEAAEIDPSCPFVYGVRALWRSGVHWEWDKAEEESQKGVEEASDPYVREAALTRLGCYLIRRGKIELGFRELPEPQIERFQCPLLWATQGDARFLARDFVGSLEILNDALGLYPHHWLLHLSRARALAALDDLNGALRSLRRARLVSDGPNMAVDAEFARVNSLLGNREGALALLKRPGALSPVYAARVHCAIGNTEGAIEALEEACARRDWYLSDLKQDCRLDVLRSDSRFTTVLNSVGI